MNSNHRRSVQRPHARTLEALCRSAIQPFLPTIVRQGIHLEWDLASDRTVSADTREIEAALAEVFGDACRAMPNGGQLNITIVVSQIGAEIEVADTRADDHRTLIANPLGPTVTYRVDRRLCPQGGLATTLLIPGVVDLSPRLQSRAQSRRAA